MTTISAPVARLAHLPTRLEPAHRLQAALGAQCRLFIKRDDCTGLGFGGNKVRKLEYALGEALARRSDVLITSGGLQSNHVRQTAAAAAKLGLELHAVLSDPHPAAPQCYRASGNLMLDGLFGARLHFAGDDDNAVAQQLEEVSSSLRLSGRRPFTIPLGASDATGSLGYVACAEELLDQAASMNLDVRYIVLCTGSAGTHAGLLTGLRLAGSAIQVLGVSSSEPSAVKVAKVRGICLALLERLGSLPWRGFDSDIHVSDAEVGPGYGQETPEATAAIALVARTEGLLLDPVYTGKAMAGLINFHRAGRFSGGGDVLFLHTGGAPALFAYADSFAPRFQTRTA